MVDGSKMHSVDGSVLGPGSRRHATLGSFPLLSRFLDGPAPAP